MPDPSLSHLASLLRPVVQPVMGRIARLRAEHQAGQMPTGVSSNLLEKTLNETLHRLRGGNLEDSWWRNILDRIGQEYIAPEFLKKPALQEWLAEEQVSDDLKALASAQIISSNVDDVETRLRLAQSYS